MRRSADQHRATIGSDCGRRERDVQLRTLPGSKCVWIGQSADGIATTVHAYSRKAEVSGPGVCNTHGLRPATPERHIAEAQRGRRDRNLLRMCIRWKKNQTSRNEEKRSPLPYQAEAGHRSHLYICARAHMRGNGGALSVSGWTNRAAKRGRSGGILTDLTGVHQITMGQSEKGNGT